MTVLDAADVVDRLRVIGPNLASRDVSNVLARGLPVTRLSRHAILVVRHVAVDVDDAGRVGSEVGDTIDDLVVRAARPRAGRVLGATDAVLFADESEFLACLLRDLAEGSAPRHWWWCHLGIDPATSIGAAIERRARVTPSAFDHLRRWGAAEDVLEAMDQADASLALAALRAEHRVGSVDGSDAGAHGAVDRDRRSGRPETGRRRHAEFRSVIDGLTIRQGRSVVFGTADRDPAAATAAITIPPVTDRQPGHPTRPLETDGGPGRPHLGGLETGSGSPEPATGPDHAIARPRLTGGRLPDQEPETTDRLGPEPAVDQAGGAPDPGVDPSSRRQVVDGFVTESGRPRADPDSGAETSTTSAPHPRRAHRRSTVEAVPDEVGGAERGIDGYDDAHHLEPLGIETSFAGLFYLLNPIRRLGLAPPDHEVNVVWPLLADLGRRLLPTIVDDRIWPLLLDLAAGPQPPWSDPEHLEGDWLDRCHDAVIAHLTAGLDLDSASIVRMISVPGVVTRTDTHLDIDLALDVVDLDARRHGLDADPGWYPETGLVIRFHFNRGDR